MYIEQQRPRVGVTDLPEPEHQLEALVIDVLRYLWAERCKMTSTAYILQWCRQTCTLPLRSWLLFLMPLLATSDTSQSLRLANRTLWNTCSFLDVHLSCSHHYILLSIAWFKISSQKSPLSCVLDARSSHCISLTTLSNTWSSIHWPDCLINSFETDAEGSKVGIQGLSMYECIFAPQRFRSLVVFAVTAITQYVCHV